jgi:hypothetical protein
LRQSESFYSQVGGRLIALAVLGMLATILFSSHYSSSTRVVEAQARRQTKNRPKGKTQTRTPLLASSFKHESHRTPKTKLNCSDCHNITSREAPDEIAAATKASIKGYPYHDSCLECHRTTAPQFFRGTTPTICAVCHTRSGPRLTKNDMNPFPKQGEIIAPEFSTYYSHGLREHQRATANCENCHLKDERAPVAIAAGGREEPYKPAVGTFKTSPSGHASCFGNCHWDKDDPKKDNCAGCHLTADAFAKREHILLPAHVVELLKDWPREFPRRLSLKFSHESKNHREAENPELVCTACHLSINRSELLDIPNVPIATCASSKCHLKTAKPSIEAEMLAEDEDIGEGRNNDPKSREGKNTCTGCHTALIGSTPPPCSHYCLFGDTYFKIEDYRKSAKQISEQCKCKK